MAAGEIERAQQRLEERKDAMFSPDQRNQVISEREDVYRRLLVGTDLDAVELNDRVAEVTPAYVLLLLSTGDFASVLAGTMTDGIIIGVLIAEERGNHDRAFRFEQAIRGAIEQLETEARMHWLRGDQLGEEGKGPGAVKGEHRIAEQLRERADELQQLLTGGDK